MQMMKTLDLNEGDPVRLNGAALPKGKMVKIQAQSTDFLQVSDPKAVWVQSQLYRLLTTDHIAWSPHCVSTLSYRPATS